MYTLRTFAASFTPNFKSTDLFQMANNEALNSLFGAYGSDEDEVSGSGEDEGNLRTCNYFSWFGVVLF